MIKPTLQEIANMPHSAGVVAMRTHYDPNWPMVTKEPVEGEEIKEYTVKIYYSYTVTDSATVTVRAASDDEAESLAETAAEKKIDDESWELEGVEIMDVSEIDG